MTGSVDVLSADPVRARGDDGPCAGDHGGRPAPLPSRPRARAGVSEGRHIRADQGRGRTGYADSAAMCGIGRPCADDRGQRAGCGSARPRPPGPGRSQPRTAGLYRRRAGLLVKHPPQGRQAARTCGRHCQEHRVGPACERSATSPAWRTAWTVRASAPILSRSAPTEDNGRVLLHLHGGGLSSTRASQARWRRSPPRASAMSEWL